MREKEGKFQRLMGKLRVNPNIREFIFKITVVS